MAQTTINQTVAHALAYYMGKYGLTEKQLGSRAGVSPRTVGNFLRPEARVSGSRGKEPSGKLTELALIACALGVDVADLVTSMSDDEREQRRRLTLAVLILAGGEDVKAKAPSEAEVH
jgi:transcriptional regulator with XRE-family HTH domain